MVAIRDKKTGKIVPIHSPEIPRHSDEHWRHIYRFLKLGPFNRAKHDALRGWYLARLKAWERERAIQAAFADTPRFVKLSRSKLKLTQGELAERLRLERRSISRYERGDDKIPLHVYCAIQYLVDKQKRAK